MTLQHSKDQFFPLNQTSSTAVFLVRTYLLQGMEKAWQESEAAYFSRSLDSSPKSGQLLFSLKMSLESERGVGQKSSKNFPAYGMTVDGECYPLRMWERTTKEKDGGCWPTPTVDGNYNRKGASSTSGDGLATAVKMWPTPRASEWKGTGPLDSKSHRYRLEKGYLDATVQEREQVTGQLNPTWVEWLMGYPCGWTVLEDWATAWFRSKREKRLKG
jgi:DNA (cytosine-5)-methyltransferase 1